MKILIIGSKGNLGRQLLGVYAKTVEAEIIGWDKEDIDLLNKKNLKNKIIAQRPEIIINAAAYNAVDKCEKDEGEFALAKKINDEAVECIIETADEIGAIAVHYSTDYVFDGKNKAGYKENAKPNPINNYGLSKLLGEQHLTKPKKARHYLIRTSKLFGVKGPSEAAKPNFFDIMLKAAKEKKEVEAVDGEKSCFTYTPDLAEATKKLLDEKSPFGIYHITNSGPATWHEACVELFKIAGIDKKVLPVSADKFPRPARRPNCSALLSTKLPPLRSYREALKEYIEKITL